MKRIALAVSLLVVAGTASAAIFVPSPSPVPSRLAPKISSLKTTLSAPEMIEARQDPVPFVRRGPPAPRIASLKEPPPDFSGISQIPQPAVAPTEPIARTAPTKASIERNPEKVVRDLTSDGNCKGRTLTSIRVEPDGRVIVQC
jgi:hypothetical protein